MPNNKKLMSSRVTHYYPQQLPYDPTNELKFSPKARGGTSKAGKGSTVTNPIARMYGQQQLLLAADVSDKKYRAALRQMMKNRAAEMQAALRDSALKYYNRAGTGRFARGIRVTGSTTESRGRLEGKIRVSLPEYRETRFLTALSRMKLPPPADPYFITAKGVKPGGEKYGALFSELRAANLGRRSRYRQGKFTGFENISGLPGNLKEGKSEVALGRFRPSGQRYVRNPLTGHSGVALRTLYQATKKRAVSRLKVPLEGYGSLGTMGNSRKEVLAPFIGKTLVTTSPELADRFQMDEVDANEAFYYPLWVIHPGFKRDPVLEETQALANAIIQEWSSMVVEYQRDLLAPLGGKVLYIQPDTPVVYQPVSAEENELRSAVNLATQQARRVAELQVGAMSRNRLPTSVPPSVGQRAALGQRRYLYYDPLNTAVNPRSYQNPVFTEGPSGIPDVTPSIGAYEHIYYTPRRSRLPRPLY